ncbi:hypothetical protein D3C80_1953290 [compost metagenome]
MTCSLVIGRIEFVGVVATTIESPDFFVGQVLDHCLELWSIEEVLTNVCAVLGLVVLVFAVDDFVHTSLQGAVAVLGEQ